MPAWKPTSRDFLLVALSLLALISTAQPGPPSVLIPRTDAQTTTFSTAAGDPYMESARAPGGLFEKLKTDANTPVQIATADRMAALIDQFDPALSNDLYNEFTNGKQDFQMIVSHIAGRSLLPQQVRAAVRPFITHLKNPSRASLTLARVSDICLLTSSSGPLVQINAGSYFYNIAYQSPIVQSGRSYAVAPNRRLLDQSDAGYLRELDAYLKSASAAEVSSFYRVLFQLLAQSNAGALGNLTGPGQTAATDFTAVYTAELIRHNMVNLDVAKDPWEIDIGEVTLTTDYGATAGQVMVNGQLVAGTADVYGKQAIGETRKDFAKLDRAITAFETAQHPLLVNNVVQLTGIQDQAALKSVGNDVFRQVFVYLNGPANQVNIKAISGALVDAMVALLAQVRADTSQITAYVKSH